MKDPRIPDEFVQQFKINNQQFVFRGDF